MYKNAISKNYMYRRCFWHGSIALKQSVSFFFFLKKRMKEEVGNFEGETFV
jgi:hypothetical protein